MISGRKILAGLGMAVALLGCATNPTKHAEFDHSMADRALEVNEAFNAELNGQILKNILRARDRQPRFYTSMSDLSITPNAKRRESGAFSGISLGEVNDLTSILSGGSSYENTNQMSLTISPSAKKDGAEAIYHEPISLSTFLTYYTHWDSNVVDNLLIDQIRKIEPGNTVGGIDVIEQILSGSDGQFKVFISDGFTAMSQASNCNLVENCQTIKAYYCFEAAQCRKTDGAFSLSGRNHTIIESHTKNINTHKKDVSLRGEGAFFLCQTSPANLSGGGSAYMYDCNLASAASQVNNAAPNSLIYVGRIADFSEKPQMYVLTTSSIDNMIYRVGSSLRDRGSEWTSNIPTKDGYNFFKVVESGSSPKSCLAKYAAQIRHHGEKYYAGPPELIEKTMSEHGCYKKDASGTVLTLIAEIIKLREVSADLNASSFFISN